MISNLLIQSSKYVLFNSLISNYSITCSSLEGRGGEMKLQCGTIVLGFSGTTKESRSGPDYQVSMPSLINSLTGIILKYTYIQREIQFKNGRFHKKLNNNS